MKQFRPYQTEAAQAIISAWKQNQNCITVVATGGGKTLIAAGTSARVQLNGGGPILYLVNRNEPCIQPMDAVCDQLGQYPGLEKATSKAPLTAYLVIANVPTASPATHL